MAKKKNKKAVLKAPKAKKARKKVKRDATFTPPQAKLTAKKVMKIRKLLADGKDVKDIAPKFKISPIQIYRIKSGIQWSHVH